MGRYGTARPLGYGWMLPSDLAELLAVLRDAGLTPTEIPTEHGPLRVILVAQASSNAYDDDADAPDEDLPPGAYDPVAARKRAAKAS